MQDEIIPVASHIAAIAIADKAATFIATPARKWRWRVASPSFVGTRAVSRQLLQAAKAATAVIVRKSAWHACNSAVPRWVQAEWTSAHATACALSASNR